LVQWAKRYGRVDGGNVTPWGLGRLIWLKKRGGKGGLGLDKEKSGSRKKRTNAVQYG